MHLYNCTIVDRYIEKCYCNFIHSLVEHIPAKERSVSEYPSSEQGTGTLSILRKYANTELALTWQAMYKFPRLRARGIPAILQFSSNQGELIENFCTSYWKLDGTNFVYGRQCWIGYFEGETLKYFDLDQAKEAQLEEIIPALRLLRTPFNGAR